MHRNENGIEYLIILIKNEFQLVCILKNSKINYFLVIYVNLDFFQFFIFIFLFYLKSFFCLCNITIKLFYIKTYAQLLASKLGI